MIDEADIVASESWLERAGGLLLVYFGPHLKEDLCPACVDRVLKARKALGAVWCYEFDRGSEGPFYCHVCDTPEYDLDKIASSNTRYKVRRCLRECRIELVEAQWLAENGYHTYREAVRRYEDFRPKSLKRFYRQMMNLAGRTDVRVHAVFHATKLIAYGVSYIRGRGVRIGPTAFDPAYSSVRPMYGVYYTMATYHLKEHGLAFVDNGWRPLLHKTNIGEFLRRLGWRQAYCRLGMRLRSPLRIALAVGRRLRHPSRVLLPERWVDMLEACLRAQDISRASRCPD